MVVGNVDLVALLTTYQGRINRAKYWIAVLCFLIIGIALGILGFIFSMIGDIGTYLILIVSVVVYIGMMVAGIFVGIKRLHDRNKSGWWLLVFMFAPGILSAVGFMIGSFVATIFSLAAFGITVWMFVELGCLRGTVGPNQYGPDPVVGFSPIPAR
jgi:uncharacterized membrane protein YhaH (DUF805 family)